MLHLFAYDLGASTGRAILGRFNGDTLALSEVARFENTPAQLPNGLFWDALFLFNEMKSALTRAVHDPDIGHIDSLGVDTWGVDFGLLDGAGALLANPLHYRDTLTQDMPEAAFSIRPKEWIFEKTGLAFQTFNTLYQLVAMKRANSTALQHAKKLLFMPDLFAYFFSGEMGTEYTVASTSQLLDPFARDWSRDVLSAFDIDAGLFTPIQKPGSIRGMLSKAMQEATDSKAIPVVAVCGHDTASAVAAVPARKPGFAYISSGTWSLLGCEAPDPVLSQAALDANYANEGGAFGTIRLLRNLMGLWIIQECKREWDKTNPQRFSEIAAQAMAAEGFRSFIDPDDRAFLYPGDMPEKVQAYCEKSGQPVPQTRGEIARTVYESLALKYRWSLERQRTIANQTYDALYIVGGGSNVELLNRLTANCLQIPVYAGPGEATAIGNLLMQAEALGEIHGSEQLRACVERSFPPVEVLPDTKAKAEWDDAYERFMKVCSL